MVPLALIISIIISFYYFDLALVSDHNYYDLSFIIRLRRKNYNELYFKES